MTSPSPDPPRWPHCGHGTTTEEPVGCRGRRIPGRTLCLAHVADVDRDAYLVGLNPGADVDHSGTPFTRDLLGRLLDALRDSATGHARLGTARFEAAVFEGNAWFASATFEGTAFFGRATFRSYAWFVAASFEGDAGFEYATFESTAFFEATTFEGDTGFESATFKETATFHAATFKDGVGFEATTFQSRALFGAATFEDTATFRAAAFEDTAWFQGATFKGDAMFGAVSFGAPALFGAVTFERDAMFGAGVFKRDAVFRAATFKDAVRFGAATFERDAVFVRAAFEGTVLLGPFVCVGRVQLSEAVFSGPATLWFAARRLKCRRTRWSSTAELRLRYTTVDFAHAVFEYPLTIAAEADPFVLPDGRRVEDRPLFRTPDPAVRLASLRGVDAAHLVLSDVDLSQCLFTGTVHLDQLRLEGNCSFSGVPPRRSRRRTLAEEHQWRARRPRAAHGWNATESGSANVGPAQLAPVYRALRKAFEDGKNEPGAADFYYGEMEMRRHDRSGSSRAERGLLHGYWLLSGYGLRASRALAWLAAAMIVTVLLLMGTGLPQDSPKQQAAGTVPPGGGRVTFEIDKADPQNPTGDRFTTKRFEKALNVTLNSVVFRSSGQDLTTTGSYIEMASRVTEPVLLGLAVLAVRNRVKR
ncbi:pentapeptide repeat-containing protein [Streptomyces sp. NPDC057307]|uniref:pentapeptide repeat-containing protein n=1 Tax=Streptomyces sp. NPDC057307 TaxID=3346096 RepID=UPI00362D473F